ncbi:hypothetical protein AVEN_168150-1 [Araneus ventricosus]|uniref:Uncharacterized protein n=1 Tax=Araneus ventricosus TaxID=182803 RepID=A0A4Y2R604_ARAVE|nr:hypothetical protein AVEN_52711-1 [Araneus ventricosus]GBN71113.1 hypothetical protein AVEN_168150-1 [Araneus ventricosus]
MQDNLLLPDSFMCIVVSSIGCGTITRRDQNASRRRGSGRWRITTTAEDLYLLQCARRRRKLTAGFAALCCCRKAHIPPNCVAQTA